MVVVVVVKISVWDRVINASLGWPHCSGPASAGPEQCGLANAREIMRSQMWVVNIDLSWNPRLSLRSRISTELLDMGRYLNFAPRFHILAEISHFNWDLRFGPRSQIWAEISDLSWQFSFLPRSQIWAEISDLSWDSRFEPRFQKIFSFSLQVDFRSLYWSCRHGLWCWFSTWHCSIGHALCNHCWTRPISVDNFIVTPH